MIFNASSNLLAKNLLDECLLNITFVKDSLSELIPYEDSRHFVCTFSVELTAENISELEYQFFKLCTSISSGPWIYLKLPKNKNEFEFEAIFNHESFIYHSKEFDNKLKWAHLDAC